MITYRSRNINGRKFTIYGDTEDRSVYPSILRHYEYENHMIDFYRELLTDGHVCIDAGANIGMLSMYMSCFTRSPIYAFEPIIENFEILKKNIEVNKLNVVPFNLALGKTNGKTDFAYDKQFKGSGSLLYEEEFRQPNDERMQVDIITLDDFVEQNEIQKIDVLKMDVEGFETSIVEGAKNVLETMRPDIVTEYCPPMIKARNLDSEGYYKLLKSYCKNIYFINRPNMTLIKINDYSQLEQIICSKRFDNIGDVYATNKDL